MINSYSSYTPGFWGRVLILYMLSHIYQLFVIKCQECSFHTQFPDALVDSVVVFIVLFFNYLCGFLNYLNDNNYLNLSNKVKQ